MKKDLYNVESSPSAGRAFVTMEKIHMCWSFQTMSLVVSHQCCKPLDTAEKILNFYLILHLITMHYIVYLSHHVKSVSEHPLGLQESCRLAPLSTGKKVQVFRQNGNQIRMCFFVGKRREIDYAVYDLLWQTSAFCRNKQQMSLKTYKL